MHSYIVRLSSPISLSSLHTGIPTFATCSIDYLSTKCVEHAFPISLDIIVVGDLHSAF